MNRLPRLLLACLLPVLANGSEQANAPEKSPVIFWAHYMPMVPHGHMHAHPHSGGNHDAWPFDSQGANLRDEYEEDIRQALESGVNGFQMLAFVPEAAFEAARKVRQETGSLFYIAPQWLYSNPKTFASTEKAITDFYQNHAGDPHVYSLGGMQVHFIWESAKTEDVLSLQKKLWELGLKILLSPTLRGLDNPELQTSRIASTGLRMAEGWSHAAPSAEEAAELAKRFSAPSPEGFLYIPAVAAGYDSSNRTGQFIHVPFNGIRSLVESLQRWVRAGFRQTVLITWNDPQETLEIPSSRNIWGHNTILLFYRGIAENGESPFDNPKVVVSYPVECLYGDRFDFQVLGLPPASAETEWRASVALYPAGPRAGAAPIVLSGSGSAAPETASLIDMSWDTSGVAGAISGIQPTVTVDYRTSPGGDWKSLYKNLPLPPVRLRYNLVQYPVPYAIELSRISSSPALALEVGSSGPLDKAILTVRGDAGEIRKVNLVDGTRSLGAFREKDRPAPEEPAFPYRDIFVRIESSGERPLALSVKNGTIRDLYGLNGKLENALKPIDAPKASFSIPTVGGENTARVARLDLAEDAELTLSFLKGGSDSLSVGWRELKNGAARSIKLDDGKTAWVSMVLTSDATDPNVDYPLQSSISEKILPLHPETDGPALLYAMAWLRSNRVAISPPVWVEADKTPPLYPAQWISTNGTFDDFVDGKSAVSLNPFTPDQNMTGFLPQSEIPWFHLDFEEGAGTRLNDRGTSQQAGRATIEIGGLKRDANAAQPPGGDWEWIGEGKSGKALRLGQGTAIRFRSKSEPVGSETVSLWADMRRAGKDGPKTWAALRAGPFRLEILSDSEAALTFERGGLKVAENIALKPREGWNHLAFSYDLSSVRLFLNGVEQTRIPCPAPAYQRTHSTPAIDFALPKTRGLGFSGILDEVQIIGTGLDAASLATIPGPLPSPSSQN